LLTYAGSLENLPESVRHDATLICVFGTQHLQRRVGRHIGRGIRCGHPLGGRNARDAVDLRWPVVFSDDVLGTQTLANAVIKAGKKVKRFIHVSSSEVYGTALGGVWTRITL